MRFPLTRSSLVIFLACALLGAVGCTHSKKPTPQDAIKSDEEDASEEPKDQSMDDNVNVSKNDTNNLAFDNEAKPKPTPPPAKEPEKVEPPAPPPPPPAPVVSDASKREVRYVIANNTAAYSDASDKGQSVGSYQAGDIIVVLMQGDWAQLSDNRYVKASTLSTKLVPRKRSNDWTTHAKVSMF